MKKGCGTCPYWACAVMERERPLFNSMGTMVGVSSSSPGLRLLVFLLVVIQGLKAQIPTGKIRKLSCKLTS